MKQNKYDDNNFFESYGKMPRSIDGLNSAGEWYILRKMLPEFQKVDGARRIAPIINITDNKSNSFHQFAIGLNNIINS